MMMRKDDKRVSRRPRAVATFLLAGFAFVFILKAQNILLGFDFTSSTTRLASSTLEDISSISCNNNNNKLSYDNKIDYSGYVPASTEQYVRNHSDALGYNGRLPAGCPIWLYPNQTNPTIHADLVQYRKDLKDYKKRVDEFTSDIKDLRLRIAEDGSHKVCQTVDLHPDGLTGIFSKSRQLSYTSSGYAEPLLPPMRHPDFCELGEQSVMDVSYLVHDFGTMCRKLKPTSRIIFFDLGASLDFHVGKSPAVTVANLYAKFGFPFDHMYSYEVTKKEPSEVFQKVPRHLLPAYHWINVGVDPARDSQLNPWNTLLDKYNEDDLIVFKLDVDTPSVEIPLAQQLLEDDRLTNLVDAFYFEHHVSMREMRVYWGRNVRGNVKTTLDLFHGLREKGVPAHFWV